MKIQIKKIRKYATLPTRGSKYSAGLDLYANNDDPITILPCHTCKIPTGISVALPDGYFAAIYARSGLATKQGLRPANCVGVCDSDYRGEYIVALYNDSDEVRVINPGDRIAQMVIQKYEDVEIEEVKELDDTERGIGGFGSTDEK